MADSKFAEHVNIIANLDNSLAMSATMSRSGIALKVGSTYDVVSVLSVHNRATSQTEYTTINGTMTSATIGAYLGLVESTIESAYPIVVTTSVTSTGTQVATLNTIGIDLTLSGSDHYIRSLNMKISLAGVEQYNIDAKLVNPLELTPSMLMLNPMTLESIAKLDPISEAITAVALIDDSVVAVAEKITAIETANANVTNINIVSGSIANVNSVATTIVPNISEILQADANAGIAITKAGESSSSANAASSSELLAMKWASESVDAVVASGKYSSYHWATKASESVAPALAHAARTDNPHAVTKAQVGLGNVSNTAQVTAVTASGALSSSGGTTPAITHSTSDGNLHVPATSTTNNGKVLTAGATAGSLSWVTPAATDLTVTAGTTAGPTINSSTGADVVIPSASATASGVVTTGAQTFAGVKTMTSPVLVTPSIGVATGTSFNSITGLASVAPAMDGVASVGTSTSVARQDHVHQSDTSKTNAVDLLMAIGNINSPLLDMPLNNSLAMKAGVGSATFTRASTATYIDRYGVLKTAAINEPRFEKGGYLNEGASTNLLVQSENFGTTWELNQSTLVSNTTAVLDPYGTNLADKLVENSTTNTHSVYQVFTNTSGILTASCFVKAGEVTKCRLATYESVTPANSIIADFDLVAKTAVVGNGTTLNPRIEELGDGWFRISSSTISAALATTTLSVQLTRLSNAAYLGNGTSGLYIFGAQLEALPFATSYIPTTTSSVTRAADNLSVTGLNNTANTNLASPVMSIIYDMDILGIGLSALSVHLSQGADTTNYWYTRNYTTNTSVGFTSEHTNLTGYGGVYGQSGTLTKRRIALSFNNSKYSLYENGIFVTEQTQATSQLTGDIKSKPLMIGNFLGTYYWHYGHISNVRIYDRALTDQEVALA